MIANDSPETTAARQAAIDHCFKHKQQYLSEVAGEREFDCLIFCLEDGTIKPEQIAEYGIPIPTGLPSSADLDAVAAEERVREATGGDWQEEICVCGCMRHWHSLESDMWVASFSGCMSGARCGCKAFVKASAPATTQAGDKLAADEQATGAPIKAWDGSDLEDSFLEALLRYASSFYGAAIDHGMKASDTAMAMQHIEQAARGIHRTCKALRSLSTPAPAVEDSQAFEELKRLSAAATQGEWSGREYANIFGYGTALDIAGSPSGNLTELRRPDFELAIAAVNYVRRQIAQTAATPETT